MKDPGTSPDEGSPQVPSSNLARRHRISGIWRQIFKFSTWFGLLALAVLILDVVNNSFGFTALTYKINPAILTADGASLEDSNQSQLIEILNTHLRSNQLKALASEKPLEQRSQTELYDLVVAQIVQPETVAVWDLSDSLFRKADIPIQAAEIAKRNNIDPASISIVFVNWLNMDFLTSAQSSDPLYAGVRTAILGSLAVIGITILFAFPIGMGASIYLQEYARENVLNRFIRTNINNLAGVPSIIYGMLGLTIFVRSVALLTSGAMLGYPNADPHNGRTILSAGLTMGLLILPVIIINGQEAIKGVPNSLREASLGLGATKWQTIWHHVLPSAFPGILTGTILGMSRAIGETAPLVIVGASTYITFNPDSVFSKFTTLPIQIYQWTSRPQDEWRSLAAAAILILLILLLSLNAGAILLRNRTTRRM